MILLIYAHLSLNSCVWLLAAVLGTPMRVCPGEGGWVFLPCAPTACPGPREYRGHCTEFTCTQPETGAHLLGLYPAPGAQLPAQTSQSGSRPTCAGVPGLNEPPDDGIAFVTGLLDTLALLLVEAVLEEDSDVGLIFIGVLGKGPGRGHGGAGLHTGPSTFVFLAPLVAKIMSVSEVTALLLSNRLAQLSQAWTTHTADGPSSALVPRR